jgi:ribonuclease VapC
VIVDSSAIIAVIRREADARRYTDALDHAGQTWMSAATYLEVAIVVDRDHDPVLSGQLDEFLNAAQIEIAAVSVHQAHLARAAYRDFGKSSGHAARLNFGDCFAYALAKDKGEPLLYKGDDFSRTDIRSVLEKRSI